MVEAELNFEFFEFYHALHRYGLSPTTFAILVCVVTWWYVCRQLQCDRVTLHKHLFTSYILSAVSWIYYYTFAALDATVVDNNPVSIQDTAVRASPL